MVAASTHPQGPFHQERLAAEALAREAGITLRAEFYKPGGPRGALQDCPADREVEVLLRTRLAALFPQYGVRGEEARELNLPPPQRGGLSWIIDPNDGTAAFIQGWRGPTVCIGLAGHEGPVLGVIYSYLERCGHGDLLSWARGEPLLRNGQPLSPPSAPAPLVISPVADVLPDALLAPLPHPFVCTPGTAWRLALAAAGDARTAVTCSNPKEWDLAAGHALLTGAGRSLHLMAGGLPIYDEVAPRFGDCAAGEDQPSLHLATLDWTWLRCGLPEHRQPLDPILPAPGLALDDPPSLARACGCLVGMLTGDNLGATLPGHRQLLPGQPTELGEAALLLGRRLAQPNPFRTPTAREGACPAQPNPFRTPTAREGACPDQPTPFRTPTAREGACPAPLADARGSDGQATGPLADARGSDGQATGPLADARGSVGHPLLLAVPLALYLAPRGLAAVAAGVQAQALAEGADPVAADACAALAVGLACALQGETTAQAIHYNTLDFARSAGLAAPVVGALKAAPQAPLTSNPGADLPALDALQNAFFQLLHSGGPVQALEGTCGLGGRTSLLGASALALMGAAKGLLELPRHWTLAVLACRALPGTPWPRPRHLRPTDALVLAERLLIRGRADS